MTHEAHFFVCIHFSILPHRTIPNTITTYQNCNHIVKTPFSY